MRRIEAEHDLGRLDDIESKESCMDRCLENSQCISFSYDAVEKICLLQGEPKELVKSWVHFSGVRCDRDWIPRRVKGKYPAVLPTPAPGET